MFEDSILIPARRIPWVKISLVGAGITSFIGLGIYFWTTKIASLNNRIELVQKDRFKSDMEKEYIKRKEDEQKECNGKRISLWGKDGCFKEYKNNK